jgi:osmotically-inducible protein OsmY
MCSRRVAALAMLVALILGLSVACTKKQNAARVDKDAIEKALDQAGFGRDVKTDIDADKGVVTLNGKVRSPELKDKAAQVVQAAAPGTIVANQISVEPVDQESAAKKIEGNVDDAIDHSYKAALTANHLDDAGIHYKVKNGVLTLEGNVKDPEIRQKAESVGASVPNVSQVVNKIDVKGK